MYIPPPFQEKDRQKLFDQIEADSFGVLVSQQNGEPVASHLPFLVQRGEAESSIGCLVSHMAKGNPQWREADGAQVLAIFSGPHAYISPTWYAEENVVPTWNYVAVHVYGNFRVIEDLHRNREIVARFVQHYEAAQPQPWKFEAEGPFAERLLAGIVGFEIEITRIEGKWKLNQNHPRERRERVATALASSTHEDARAVSALMRQSLP